MPNIDQPTAENLLDELAENYNIMIRERFKGQLRELAIRIFNNALDKTLKDFIIKLERKEKDAI